MKMYSIVNGLHGPSGQNANYGQVKDSTLWHVVATKLSQAIAIVHNDEWSTSLYEWGIIEKRLHNEVSWLRYDGTRCIQTLAIGDKFSAYDHLPDVKPIPSLDGFIAYCCIPVKAGDKTPAIEQFYNRYRAYCCKEGQQGLSFNAFKAAFTSNELGLVPTKGEKRLGIG